ncbi:MAG: RNA-binding protein [Rhodobiaceae bacterium]|nr:RNA-binding protein [Rhodobiaceae bacterium]MCC0055371.1 RNA-binding protein [Rhodobiaceae bacterium]
MSPHDAAALNEETDAGPRDRGPERLCIVDRRSQPRERLIRFVLSPDNVVTPDLKQRLPGRGVWVGGEAGKVAEAVKRRLFARAFRREVTVSPGLPDEIAVQMKSAALGALGLSRRAGDMVLGFAKVEAMLRSGGAGLLLHASDARPDGVRKLDALTGGFLPICRAFTGEELSLALGSGNVIHAAVKAGPRLEGTLGRCRAYERYLGEIVLPDGNNEMTGPRGRPEEQDE